MTETKLRRVTRLIIGDRKFDLGQKAAGGVIKDIEIQPPVARVHFEDGTALDAYFPQETAYWYHEERPDIVVPTIVAPDDVGGNDGK